MKKLMMTLALLSATACTTVATTPAPESKDQKAAAPKEEKNLREVRQQALLEALTPSAN